MELYQTNGFPIRRERVWRAAAARWRRWAWCGTCSVGSVTPTTQTFPSPVKICMFCRIYQAKQANYLRGKSLLFLPCKPFLKNLIAQNETSPSAVRPIASLMIGQQFLTLWNALNDIHTHTPDLRYVIPIFLGYIECWIKFDKKKVSKVISQIFYETNVLIF